MSSPKWAARFGISDREFAELQIHLAGSEDALRWCLLRGRIPLQDYMQWATETYDLPLLRDEFFSVPADPGCWDAVKSQFDWTSSFFPLAEWQGVLLIGCLEPPRFHFPLSSKHSLVVASPTSLESRFHEYEPAKAYAPVSAPTPVQVTQTVKVAPPKLPTERPAQIPATPLAPLVAEAPPKVRQRPADEVMAEDLPPAPDVSLSDPEGLVVEIAPPSSPNLFIVPDGLPLTDIGRPISSKPDGFEQDSVIMNLSDFDFSSPTLPLVNLPKNNVSSITTIEKPSLSRAVESLGAEPPRASLPKVPPAPPVVGKTPMPLAPATTLTPPPIPTILTARVSTTEPAVALSTCVTPDSLMSATVAHIARIFEHGLILNFSRNELRPVKWSELLWSAKGDKPDAVSLEKPSLFRIVHKSSLPYHGYVNPSDAGIAFFNDFNRGLTAKHVTLIPIVLNGQLDSMLMGLSMGEVDFKGSLAQMEKLAADYASQAVRFKVKKAA